MKIFAAALIIGLSVAGNLSSLAAAAPHEPLPRAHAHNDYLHPRPLHDALAHGFRSVEADIWLTNGTLLVAHDLDKVHPSRTLESLYLQPLRTFVRTNSGPRLPITLLIDIKSEAEATYKVLARRLEAYSDILSRFESNRTVTQAVTVVLSGNRPVTTLSNEVVRYAAIDGRLPDLDGTSSAVLIPLISDNWTRHFTWRGIGPLPAAERMKLRQMVERTHTQGRRLRFWATPDNPAGWKELNDAGVDLLNTDRLPELERFLRKE